MDLSRCIALSVGHALLLGASTGAQSRAELVFARVARPMKSVVLDLATGTIVRGPAVRERTPSTIADFSNLDLSGFIGVDTGGGACEWIDAASKGFAGNSSDLMTEIVSAYCTVMADTALGGPGGSTMLGFYEGYHVGGPAPTTAVAMVQLSGLPGHTANSSFLALFLGSGGTSCYFLDVVFAECVAFADGPIGYSWRFTDLGTTGVYAGTLPFLACVQSCSGRGPDGQGMVFAMDQYCPPGSVVNSFSFASVIVEPPFDLSIAMEIREARDAEATAATFLGDGDNDHVLAAGAIAIGGTWSASVTLQRPHQATGSAPMSLRVRASCVNGPSLSSPVGGRPIESLTTGSLALVLAGTHGAAQGVPWPFPIFAVPCDVSLIGLSWAAQGTVLGGGFGDLTSARCGVVGSIDALADP